jgi:O-antigen/teichoic acid export membrane protein
MVTRFGLGAALNYAFGVALAWLLAPRAFGAVSVLQSVQLFCSAILTAGFPWALASAVARSPEPRLVAPAYRAALLGNGVLGVLLVAGFLGLQSMRSVIPGASTTVVVWVCLMIALLSLNTTLVGALQGERRFDGLGVMQTVEIAVKAAVAMLLVGLVGAGVGGVAAGFVVGAAVSAAIGMRALRDRLPGAGPVAWRPTAGRAGSMGVATAALGMMLTLDVLALSLFGRGRGAGAAQVAVYQAALVLGRAPYFVGDALSNAVFPFIARAPTSVEARAWFVAAYRLVPLVLVPLQLILLIAPGPVLRLFFPEHYAGAAAEIRVVTVGTLGLLTMDMVLKALNARELHTAVARLVPVALLVEVVALAAAVPRWGPLGAAAAFALGSWTGAALLSRVYVAAFRPVRIRFGVAARYLLALAPFAGVLALADRLPLTLVMPAIAGGLGLYAVAAVRLRLTREDDVARVLAVLPRVFTATRPLRQVLAGRAARLGRGARRRHVPLFVTCSALAAFFLLWNLAHSPDTQYDEVVYSRADQAVAQGWRLTWTNRPLFVHPPLSFLVQAAWLRVLGVAGHPLVEVITHTRFLAALAAAADVVLIAAVVHRLTATAPPRRRAALVLVTAALGATDPVLLRFGRMAAIEPFALLGCLITLNLAIALHRRRPAVYILALGLATGLTLLTNEICIFMLLTPTLYALVARQRRFLWSCVASLGAGLVLWFVFALWAIQLGLFSTFVTVKSITLQRLFGLVQITGWNRPGFSFVSGLRAEVGQYFSSYLLLAGGAVALLWLFLHRGGTGYRWLLAWLITSYAFGAYTVLLGTLNEQFFVYVVPAALVGTVLLADALLRPRLRTLSVAVPALAALLALSVASWGRFYDTRNDAIARLTRYADAALPTCGTVNASGDRDRFQLVMPDRPFAEFATAAGALSHGVNLFILSDKDADLRYGNSNPTLTAWVRTHGSLLVSYPSATYRGLSLWRVTSDPYDPAVGVERFPGGNFVVTQGSRCGGFPVVDGRHGRFATAWARLGGKAVAGPPLTDSWGADRGFQAFAGGVLSDSGGGDTETAVTMLPIVQLLAERAPAVYRQAGLPPATTAAGTGNVDTLLTDRTIASFYRGPLGALLGSPLGPPAPMPGGTMGQAFPGGVLQHRLGSAEVRLAPVGQLALAAGIVVPAAAAATAVPVPALPQEEESPQPTTVEPFVRTLAAALGFYAIVSLAVLARDRVGSLTTAVCRRRRRRFLLTRVRFALRRRLAGRSGTAQAPLAAAGPPVVGRAAVPQVQLPSRVVARSRAPSVYLSRGARQRPSIGSVSRIPRRSALARLGLLAALPVAGLAARVSGVLGHHVSTLPALPDVAVVQPGVIRSGQPEEPDFVRIRDDYGVRAVVSIDGRNDFILSDIEEQAVVQNLGMGYLQLNVPDGAAPTVMQVYAVAELIRTTRPATHVPQNLILLHDQTGRGPVVLLAAMVQILDHRPLGSVLDGLPAGVAFSPQQNGFLRQLADGIQNGTDSRNPYAKLDGNR